MQLHYRIINDGIEIVRCFGADPALELPEKIDGRPVKRMAPYAFSARKDREDEDVLIFETDEERMFSGEEKLLAGEALESVRLPDTMEEAGRYLFYGCRNLRELHFSDRLKNIGSGAFTGCRSLSALYVRLLDGDRSCVSDILGDLWQRIDVTFYKDGKEARLVFPEHYEEAVENTPARIVETHYHGSGGNYRQCFYQRELNFAEYDGLLPRAVAEEKEEVVVKIAALRLLCPYKLSAAAKERYEAYLAAHMECAGKVYVQKEDVAMLRFFGRAGLWSEPALGCAVDAAEAGGKTEVLGLLMDERRRLFPKKKKVFEL